MPKKQEILYPSYLDTAFEVSIKNESIIPYPYVYRVVIHDAKTGKRINPSDSKDYWAQYPDPFEDEDLFIDTSRELQLGEIITFRINVALLLERNDNKYGKYLISFYTSNQENNYSLAEDVQRVFFQIYKPGKNPKNIDKFIPFKDEEKLPYVKLNPFIKVSIYLDKSPSPYFELEDSTYYNDIPDTKIYKIIDSLKSGVWVDEIKKTTSDNNLNDVIKSSDFSFIIKPGNVISFTTHLKNGKRASLKPPFDEFENQLENNEIGVPQNFQFVITSIEYQNIVNDLLNDSFIFLSEKYIENLFDSSLSLYELLISNSISYISMIGIIDNADSLLFLENYNLSLVDLIANPDIVITNNLPNVSSGNMNLIEDIYSGEYGDEINFNFTVENLFRSPINFNKVKLQVKIGENWFDVEEKAIQPESDYWFGIKNETFNVGFLTLNKNSIFTSINESFNNSLINKFNFENLIFTRITDNSDLVINNLNFESFSFMRINESFDSLISNKFDFKNLSLTTINESFNGSIVSNVNFKSIAFTEINDNFNNLVINDFNFKNLNYTQIKDNFNTEI